MIDPLVSIIIVNWNGNGVLRDCFDSLSNLKYPNWELVLVDNGSTDGSEEYLKEYKFKNKFLLKSNKNLGFSGGNNLGYKRASGKYVLLLNNDTIVKADFLSKLIDRIHEDDSLGVVQPKIRIMADHSILDTVGSYLTITGFLEHIGFLEKDRKIYDQERFVFSAKGACILIRKEIIDKIGLFDDDYGSYLEDTDFCWKVWLYGYKVLYYPKAEIFHKVGFSSKRQKQTIVNYNSFKNRICTLIKNLGFKNLIVIGGIHLVLIITLGIYYLVTLRLGESKSIWEALFWNINNLRKTLKKRSKVQSFRTKTDDEIFKYILKNIDLKKMLKHFIRSEKAFAGKHEV